MRKQKDRGCGLFYKKSHPLFQRVALLLFYYLTPCDCGEWLYFSYYSLRAIAERLVQIFLFQVYCNRPIPINLGD